MYIGEMGREVKRPIILQGTMAAPKEGHMRLPDQFYQGLHFGLSAWDEWGEKVSMRSVFQAVRKVVGGKRAREGGEQCTLSDVFRVVLA